MVTRRHLLSLGILAPAALRAVPKTEITGMEVFTVRVNRRGNWLIVRLKTNSGLTGLGDASHGNDAVTRELLAKFFDRAKGYSAFDVEQLKSLLWYTVGQHRFSGPCAFSAIEQAMYDIQGKALGVPCWQLFGGRIHSRIRNYANINRATDDREPAGFAAVAERAVKAGFTAIKLASFDGMPKGDPAARARHTDRGIACIAAVRKVAGPDRDVLVDGHSNFDLQQALDVTRRLEPLRLFWWEEATPGIPNLAKVNEAAKMPTAGGESLLGVEQFIPYVTGKAADIMMPDVKYCGGMLELKKIAALAEGAGLAVSPHGPASPIGNQAAAHICATLPNFQILEHGFGEVSWRADLITPAETFDPDGFVSLADRPGLGIELNDKLAASQAL